MQGIVQAIQEEFTRLENKKYAVKMDSYMKNKFSHLGINAGPRRNVVSEHYDLFKSMSKINQQKIIDELWNLDKREYHQAGLDLASKIVKKTDISWLPYWEEKIISNSWWDSVDFIAPSLIGPLLVNEIDLQNKFAYKWMDDGNLWLQRSAIIFQLKYKNKTNSNLLFEMILASAHSKEFFIKKAGGWALREYGKYNGSLVSEFINQYRHTLSTLTVKEGERRLIK